MLVSTVDLFWRARRANELRLKETESLRFDWKSVIDRKDRTVESWSKGKEENLRKQRITVVGGKGKFSDPHEISVDGKKLTGKKIIIATGFPLSAGQSSLPWQRVDLSVLKRLRTGGNFRSLLPVVRS